MAIRDDGREILSVPCLTFCYNLFGIDQSYVRASDPVPEGNHQLRLEVAHDGGGLGKGGDVKLYVDGVEAGSGRRAGDNAFTGTIEWIELEGGEDSHDHLIDPEDVIRVAMAKQ